MYMYLYLAYKVTTDTQIYKVTTDTQILADQ